MRLNKKIFKNNTIFLLMKDEVFLVRRKVLNILLPIIIFYFDFKKIKTILNLLSFIHKYNFSLLLKNN